MVCSQVDNDAGGRALHWTKQNVIRFKCDDTHNVQMEKWMQHDFPKTCPHTASITLESLWSQRFLPVTKGCIGEWSESLLAIGLIQGRTGTFHFAF